MAFAKSSLNFVRRYVDSVPNPTLGSMKSKVSREMQALVGVPVITRVKARKAISDHIECNNLQDPENINIFICDDKLKKIFPGKDRVGFHEIEELIDRHFH